MVIPPDRLVNVAEGHAVCTHERISERLHKPGRIIYGWRHYLEVVQRKPGALRNGATLSGAFRSSPPPGMVPPPVQTYAGGRSAAFR